MLLPTETRLQILDYVRAPGLISLDVKSPHSIQVVSWHVSWAILATSRQLCKEASMRPLFVEMTLIVRPSSSWYLYEWISDLSEELSRRLPRQLCTAVTSLHMQGGKNLVTLLLLDQFPKLKILMVRNM